MTEPSILARRLSAVVAAVALAVAATSCSGGSGGPMQPVTTGSIRATGQWSSGGALTCIDSGTWRYTLVTATGSDGEQGPVVHTHTGQQSAPSAGVCTSSDLATFLRFGTWRVSWGSYSCQIDVPRQPWVIIEPNGNCRTTF